MSLLTKLRSAGFRPYLVGEVSGEILKIKGPRDRSGVLIHLPERLRSEVREGMSALIAELVAEQWTDRLDQLFNISRNRGHTPAEAERYAYLGVLWEWHCQHHQPSPDKAKCPVCGGPVKEGERMPWGDGSGGHTSCGARYRELWEPAAKTALAELGLAEPNADNQDPHQARHNAA
jgi:hypothetical protein